VAYISNFYRSLMARHKTGKQRPSQEACKSCLRRVLFMLLHAKIRKPLMHGIAPLAHSRAADKKFASGAGPAVSMGIG
jgi:hypothetical protein